MTRTHPRLEAVVSTTDDMHTLLDEWRFVNSENVCGCGHRRREHIPSHGRCCPDSPCRDEDCPCDDYHRGHISRADAARLLAAVEAMLAEHPATRLGCIAHYAHRLRVRAALHLCDVRSDLPLPHRRHTLHAALIGDGDE